MSDKITLSKRQGWTGLPNTTIEDRSIPLEALGLLVLLLSNVDGWVFHRNDIQKRAAVGNEKFDRMLRDLKLAGYLRVERQRTGNGRFCGWKWHISDDPTETRVSRDSVKPKVGKPGGIRTTTKKEEQSERTPIAPKGGHDEFFEDFSSQGFKRFWDAFPKKMDEDKAEKAWTHALKSGATAEQIIEGAERYSEECFRLRTELRYIKGPQGWLKDRRWKNYLPEEPKPMTLEERARRLGPQWGEVER